MPQKDFKNIDEQLIILEKRGLIIEDKEKAKQCLLLNNYYNLINGYGKFFQTNTDKYIADANFNEIYELYLADKEIKQTLFNAILNVEHHLKSILAYRFSETYPNERYAYLNINNYSSNKVLNISFTLSKLFHIINVNKKRPNNAIYHYVKKYKNVPMWVIVDFIDFGDLYSIIANLPTSLQNKIAQDFKNVIKENVPNFKGVFTPEVMISLIKNIHEIRNVCAHNNRLYNFNCRSDTMYFKPLFEKYSISANQDRKSVYTTFISLQCFLSKREFDYLNNTLHEKFKLLAHHLNSISILTVLNTLGFPNNWM